MKFSIRGLFSFEFSLAIPRFWKQEPARIAADYELERFFIAGFTQVDPAADPWQAVEVAVCMIAGHALLAPGKDQEPLFPEL